MADDFNEDLYTALTLATAVIRRFDAARRTRLALPGMCPLCRASSGHTDVCDAGRFLREFAVDRPPRAPGVDVPAGTVAPPAALNQVALPDDVQDRLREWTENLDGFRDATNADLARMNATLDDLTMVLSPLGARLDVIERTVARVDGLDTRVTSCTERLDAMADRVQDTNTLSGVVDDLRTRVAALEEKKS